MRDEGGGGCNCVFRERPLSQGNQGLSSKAELHIAGAALSGPRAWLAAIVQHATMPVACDEPCAEHYQTVGPSRESGMESGEPGRVEARVGADEIEIREAKSTVELCRMDHAWSECWRLAAATLANRVKRARDPTTRAYMR